MTAEAIRVSLVRIRRPSLNAAAAASFALILPLAFFLNIWQDEAYTLHTTAHGIAYAFSQSLSFEQNAPLYFVALSLWRALGQSIFFLRLFSVICAAGALALVAPIARRYVPRTDPGMIALATAWNPFFFWAATEMRAYAMMLLVSALLLVTFYDAFLAPQPRRYWAVVYGACAVLALYTQYYFAFLIVAQFVVLCLYRRGSLPGFLLAANAAVLAFTPLLVVVPRQVANFRAPFAAPGLLKSYGVLGSILAHFILPLPFAHPAIAYGIIILVLSYAVAFAAGRRWIRTGGDGVLPLMTALAALVFAGVTHAGGVIVLNRHAASLYIPAVVSVFALLTFLQAHLRARATTVWFFLAMIASTIALVQSYAYAAKPGDWQRLVAVLAQRERPGEPIAVFEAENALALQYYYRGPNRIVPIPTAVNFEGYDVSKFVVRDDRQMREAMPRANRIWLITAGECASADLQFGCAIVERYVAEHYRTQFDRRFFQARLRLLTPWQGQAAKRPLHKS